MTGSKDFSALHRIDEAHAPSKDRPNRALELLAEETSLAYAVAQTRETKRPAASPVGGSNHEAPDADREIRPPPDESLDHSKPRPDLDTELAQALLDVQSEQIAAHLQSQLDDLARQRTEIVERWDELRLAEEETKRWVAERLAEVSQAQEAARIEREEVTARLQAAEAAEELLTRNRAFDLSRLKDREFTIEQQTRELEAREQKLLAWEDRVQAAERALDEQAARHATAQRDELQRLRANEQRAVTQIADERAQIERLLANVARKRASLDERERSLVAWTKRLEATAAERRAVLPNPTTETTPGEIVDAHRLEVRAVEARKFYQAAEQLRREAAELLRETLRNRLALDELWLGLVDHASRETLLEAIEEIHREIASQYAAEEKRLRKRQREIDAILNSPSDE